MGGRVVDADILRGDVKMAGHFEEGCVGRRPFDREMCRVRTCLQEPAAAGPSPPEGRP